MTIYWILNEDMLIFVKILRMKALILEREEQDTVKLQSLCRENCPGITVLDIAKTLEEVQKRNTENEYEVIFLDLDSTQESVFDFLKSNTSYNTQIVITAKQEEKILEAYEHHIAGFLVKPLEEKKFQKTMKRIRKVIGNCGEADKGKYSYFKDLIQAGKINRIALTTLEGYIIVHYDDIIRCEANGNYTSVYFHDGSFLMLTKTLKHYAEKLEKHGFFRVHKTHLVNLNYIRCYVKGKNSYVELKDGSKIEVSSRKKQHLVEKLNY